MLNRCCCRADMLQNGDLAQWFSPEAVHYRPAFAAFISMSCREPVHLPRTPPRGTLFAPSLEALSSYSFRKEGGAMRPKRKGKAAGAGSHLRDAEMLIRVLCGTESHPIRLHVYAGTRCFDAHTPFHISALPNDAASDDVLITSSTARRVKSCAQERQYTAFDAARRRFHH